MDTKSLPGLLARALLGSWLALGASCTVEENCPEGSRGCPCADSGGCQNSNLSCVDNVCVWLLEGANEGDEGNQGNAASGSGPEDEALCEGSCEAAFAKCNIDEIYRQPCLDDCEQRRANQPEECADEFDAGLVCQASAEAWSCEESGQAVDSGCEEQRTAHQSCLDGTAGPVDGPATRCPAFPGTTGVAGLNEALGESPKVQLSVVFYNQGSLRTLDGEQCEVSSATEPPSNMLGWIDCWEGYECGGCEMWLGYFEGDDEVDEGWYLIRPNEGAGEDCDAFDAFYEILTPAQGASSEGSEAPLPSSGAGDPCGDCLDTCQGLSGCCTGSGCICQSACAPSGCSPPAVMCCGPYGDCFCTSNCPY